MKEPAIRALLIEDNPGDARLIREMLNGGEFTLMLAETLGAGLQQSHEHPVDVILLDLSLPDSKGIDTILKVRAEVPHIAIVVLTGFDDITAGIQAVQHGAQDYLVKGEVEPQLLRRSIRYAIERHRIETALRRSEEEYRSLIDDVFDTSTVGVIILDSSYRVVWCNKALEVYFGIERQEILGKEKRHLIDMTLKWVFADPHAYADRLLDAYERGIFTDRFECHVLAAANRQDRWLEHWSQPIHAGLYAGGRIVQYTDITNRKRLEFAEGEQRKFAEALRDIATALTSTLDLDEVLDRILENIGLFIPHDIASVTLSEDMGQGQEQRRRSSKPYMQSVLAGELLEMEISQLIHRLQKSRQPIVISDLQAEEPLGETAKKTKVRSYVGVPILLQEEIIGFINLFARAPNVFSAESIERLAAFGEQSAIAIQNARLYRQSRDLIALEERQRLARDLHDSVSQTLFTCSALAESALRKWEKTPQRAHELLKDVHQLTMTALSEMRILLLELRPEVLTEINLRQLFENYLKPIQKQRGLALELRIEDVPNLSPDVQMALYRITQEALNNIDKHAHASAVTISLRAFTEGFELIIQDNGTGFNINETVPTSLGLRIMRERADAINASLQITSEPTKGTQIQLVRDTSR